MPCCAVGGVQHFSDVPHQLKPVMLMIVLVQWWKLSVLWSPVVAVMSRPSGREQGRPVRLTAAPAGSEAADGYQKYRHRTGTTDR